MRVGRRDGWMEGEKEGEVRERGEGGRGRVTMIITCDQVIFNLRHHFINISIFLDRDENETDKTSFFGKF